MYFETMLLDSYKFRNCYIFLMNWTFYYYQKYLYFWQWFLIKIYFDIYIAISPFFWLVFVWCIFSILLLSVFLCPYIWDSYKYLWIGFVFCFYSAYNLCLLREVFTTYIFVNDIFIYIQFIPIIENFSHLFHLFYVWLFSFSPTFGSMKFFYYYYHIFPLY